MAALTLIRTQLIRVQERGEVALSPQIRGRRRWTASASRTPVCAGSPDRRSLEYVPVCGKQFPKSRHCLPNRKRWVAHAYRFRKWNEQSGIVSVLAGDNQQLRLFRRLLPGQAVRLRIYQRDADTHAGIALRQRDDPCILYKRSIPPDICYT